MEINWNKRIIIIRRVFIKLHIYPNICSGWAPRKRQAKEYLNREDNQSDANRYGHVKSCVFTWTFASNERRTSSKRISECMVESEFLRCSFRATAQINTQLCLPFVIDNRNLIYYEMSLNQIEIGFLCNLGHDLTRTINETEDCWVERNMKYLDLWINERFHWNLNLPDKH